MREGGFWIVFMARLSAIPGHFTTAVFATCGMNVWIFIIATFVTLPKQLITVYLGVLIHNKDTSTKNKVVSYTVLAVGFREFPPAPLLPQPLPSSHPVVTVYAAWYIYHQMHKVRVIVWRRLRIQAASRGIALGQVGYASGDPELGRVSDEAATPILQTHPHRTTTGGLAPGGRDERSSYVNPYDIRYDREGDMSVYHVDAMTERVNMEEDIADRVRRMRSPPPAMPPVPEQYRSTGQAQDGEGFPQAQPSGVKREPSSASAFYKPGQAQPQAIPSTFPVAAPVPQPPNHERYGVPL